MVVSYPQLFWNRYAKDLVKIMYSEDAPDFGAASDGTCMIYDEN